MCCCRWRRRCWCCWVWSVWLQREGTDRWQAVPAILVGSGLVIHAVVGRRRRRHKLLVALRSSRFEED